MINVLFYRTVIDSVLLPLHRTVVVHAKPSSRIIDIACGTGALAMAMARTAHFVTGIDLSEENITSANRMAQRKGLTNTTFEVRDASDLSCFADFAFDLAVTSMAVHQFDAGLAVHILNEMKRIARRVIIADYNRSMPGRWRPAVAWSIERIAGGEHFRNFRTFMRLGGIPYFTREAGITIVSETTVSGGVFVVALSGEQTGIRKKQ